MSSRHVWTIGVGGCPPRPRLPQGRPCSTLRRCGGSRPGSGWDRVGPPRSRPRAPPDPQRPLRSGTHRANPAIRTWIAGVCCTARTPGSMPVGVVVMRFRARRGAPRLGNGARSAAPRKSLPSIIRTRQLRSVARRPPRAYQPGRLPGILPAHAVGYVVLGKDSRLDAFSGSPVRTWLLSDARCQTTDPPAVRPTRSSRTRVSVPHVSNAHGG